MRKQGDLLFKQTDIERLLRAHQAMGVDVTIEVGPDGTMRAIPLRPVAAGASTNPWDDDGTPPAKIRPRV
jgi:hypothetical protein